MNIRQRLAALSLAALATPGCAMHAPHAASTLESIDTVVVIYAENRSFDNLYGLFPGADGIADALKNPETYLQKDRDGVTVLPHLPPAWSAKGDPRWDFIAQLPNKPFRIDAPPGGAPAANGMDVSSPDLVHRYYNHQLQIHGGRNDRFAAFSDAGGLAMGHYDGSSMQMWQFAREYTLADHFFMGAFGGSFLNHFWLVCACTPSVSHPPAGRESVLDPQTGLLAFDKSSALDGPPRYTGDANFTPADEKTGVAFAINTTQPPYQPSGTPPAAGGNPALADAAAGGHGAVLEPQVATTIGDTLSRKGVSWAWYAGGWKDALADGMQPASQPRKVIYNRADGAADFQAHHQPFNYFRRFDPSTPAGRAERAAHLKDYRDFVADIAKGRLPAVTFYKPQGSLDQHPGYSDVMSGDEHIADIVHRLQASPQWPHMFIVVTYDENGGFWDHVPPPAGDRWGPGSRIPAIFISPFVKRAHVEHRYYDTTSIAKFITRRFGLDPLPGVRAAAGDLTEVLQ